MFVLSQFLGLLFDAEYQFCHKLCISQTNDLQLGVLLLFVLFSVLWEFQNGWVKHPGLSQWFGIWQSWRSWPLSFLLQIWLILCHKMNLTTLQWSTLQSGSQIIDYNHCFCDNFFSVCLLQSQTFFSVRWKTKHQWRKQNTKEIITKAVITIKA